MSQITIPDDVAAALEKAGGRVELKTRSGRVLGAFTPEPLVPWDPSITREELDRRARESGRPWSEIRKRFEGS